MTTGFVDVFFRGADVSDLLAGWQLQIDMSPPSAGIALGIPSRTDSADPKRPGVFLTAPANLGSNANRVRVTDFLASGAEPIVSQQGLVRIPFQVDANLNRRFELAIHLPNSSLSDGNGNPIPFQAVSGLLAVRGPLVATAWAVDSGGNWSTTANWTAGIPDGEGTLAHFGNLLTAPRTIQLDAPRTLGGLEFDSTQSYSIVGAAPLSLLNASLAEIHVASGSHIISAPLAIGAGTPVLKTGPGELTIRGPLAASAGGMLLISEGTLRLRSDAQGMSAVMSGSGTLELTGSQHLEKITMVDAAKLVVAPTGIAGPSSAATILTRQLVIENSARAALDLADGALVVEYGTEPSPIHTLTGYLQSGINLGGAIWTGPGIHSSVARDDPAFVTAVGIVDNRDTQYDTVVDGHFGYGIPGGSPLSSTAVLLALTYIGDLDLNGKVDGDDMVSFLVGFAHRNDPGSVAQWASGDLDYSGTIDGDDLASLLYGYAHQHGPLGMGDSFAAVPEPDSRTLAGIATACGLAAWLRRQRLRTPAAR